MTTDTDTAEALEAAIDAIACRRCDSDDPIGSTDRSALHRAITAHVEAEVARRLAAAPDVEATKAWGCPDCLVELRRARPTPDEARSIGRVAEHLRGLAAEVEPSRMADGFEADRMRLLAHRLRQVAALMPDSEEARRLVEEFERACDAWQYREAEARTAARTALLRALGVEA